MKESHFQAERLASNGGYTWTLVTRLGDMLQQAINLYGPRDMSWTILGVEFVLDGPRIWYPESRKDVVVQLGRLALNDTVQACYQLAHESIHLLAPFGSSLAPALEEGLATVFSEDYVKAKFGVIYTPETPSYQAAASLVRHLLSADPKAIKKLREVELSFMKMTQETFDTAKVIVPEGLIQKLLQPFVRS
ncbi:hypothetical protein [Pseudomonas viridiflava]|uniref:hypothetical protein n=1 Tax=Pseudomonas viridiflava TaxID=33069 RepID=UPI002EA3DE29|nr:hypothetical protein [Pseudomonas viridiflava]